MRRWQLIAEWLAEHEPALYHGEHGGYGDAILDAVRKRDAQIDGLQEIAMDADNADLTAKLQNATLAWKSAQADADRLALRIAQQPAAHVNGNGAPPGPYANWTRPGSPTSTTKPTTGASAWMPAAGRSARFPRRRACCWRRQWHAASAAAHRRCNTSSTLGNRTGCPGWRTGEVVRHRLVGTSDRDHVRGGP